MAPGQHAAVRATCRRLHGSALRLLRRHAGQSGISSTVKTIGKLLRNVLSRLHPGARWRLLRGRGGLTGRRPRSSVRVLRTGNVRAKLRKGQLLRTSKMDVRIGDRSTFHRKTGPLSTIRKLSGPLFRLNTLSVLSLESAGHLRSVFKRLGSAIDCKSLGAGN